MRYMIVGLVVLGAAGGVALCGGGCPQGTSVKPLDGKFTAIDGGFNIHVALRDDGSLYAWGYEDAHGMTQVPGGNDFVAISASENHALALRSDGSVVAWGNNEKGQCDVPTSLRCRSISAGSNFSLAVRDDGTFVSWGEVPGDGSPPSGSDYVAAMAGNSYSIALRADGWVVFWDDVKSYQLYGNDFVRLVPGVFGGGALRANGTLQGFRFYNTWDYSPIGKQVVDFAEALGYAIALCSDGSLMVWDSATNTPCNPAGGKDYVAVSGGGYDLIALKADGSVEMWNASSICPSGSDDEPFCSASASGMLVAGWPGTVEMSCSISGIDSEAQKRLTVKANLSAFGGSEAEPIMLQGNRWIANVHITPSASGLHDIPVTVTDEKARQTRAVAQVHVRDAATARAKRVFAGYAGSGAVLLEDGRLITWAQNDPVRGVHTDNLRGPFQEVALAGAFIAVRTDGSIITWGFDAPGHVAAPSGTNYQSVDRGGLILCKDGSLACSLAEVDLVNNPLPGGRNFIAIARALALRSDGSLAMWPSTHTYATGMPATGGFVSIAADGPIQYGTYLALRADGSVFAWGSNETGITSVPIGLRLKKASIGSNFAAGIQMDGTLVAWGLGSNAVDLPAGEDFADISVDTNYGLALRANGSVVSFGLGGSDESYVPPDLQ